VVAAAAAVPVEATLVVVDQQAAAAVQLVVAMVRAVAAVTALPLEPQQVQLEEAQLKALLKRMANRFTHRSWPWQWLIYQS